MDYEKYVRIWVDAGLYIYVQESLLLSMDNYIPKLGVTKLVCWFDKNHKLVFHNSSFLRTNADCNVFVKICHLSHMGV